MHSDLGRKSISRIVRGTALLLPFVAALACAATPPACRTEVLEGEVDAGHVYRRPIGNGLNLLLEPIHSGWILRVLPAGAGHPLAHDYAELATPPYQSITPLSLSTDFAFRAQDAVGWNPRRFRFASSGLAYRALERAYQAYAQGGPNPSPGLQAALTAEVAQAAEALFTIEDARLVPGAADQWSGAAAVSSRFTETAHTLVLPAANQATPLGQILWLRFRVELELPPGFAPAPGARILPHVCGSR